MSVFVYEAFEDGYGMPMWACWRDGSGLCGYGHTQRDALNDFLDKEQELLPAKQYRTVDCGHEEPHDIGRPIPEYVDEEHE